MKHKTSLSVSRALEVAFRKSSQTAPSPSCQAVLEVGWEQGLRAPSACKHQPGILRRSAPGRSWAAPGSLLARIWHGAHLSLETLIRIRLHLEFKNHSCQLENHIP